MKPKDYVFKEVLPELALKEGKEFTGPTEVASTESSRQREQHMQRTCGEEWGKALSVGTQGRGPSSCSASRGFWPLSQGQVGAIKGFYTPE